MTLAFRQKYRSICADGDTFPIGFAISVDSARRYLSAPQAEWGVVMVAFLSARDVAGLVVRAGAAAFWARLVDYLRDDFLAWDSFDKTPRLAFHAPGGVMELMPAANRETFAFKYVNGHPGNTQLCLQTVVAFGALVDVATGYPLLLADMTLATALRTAATSALAARHLARADSRTMALVGLGAQSEFQASAFRAILGVDRLRVFDIDPEAVEKFERNMAGSGVEILRCADARAAARGADIVTTLTADRKRATILTADMIAPGVHINGVGGDCPGKTELSRELLLRGRIFVEYAPQTRIEGDSQQLSADHPVTELHEVVAGRKTGRESAQRSPSSTAWVSRSRISPCCGFCAISRARRVRGARSN
jgi:ornithine cyclodeaminase